MDEEIKRLISRLEKTCNDQIGCYDTLLDIVQRISGKLAVSRGDISGVMSLFEEKKSVLDRVVAIKREAAEDVEKWCSIKDQVSDLPEAEELNSILLSLQERMNSFLDMEEQIEQYIKPVIEGNDPEAESHE